MMSGILGIYCRDRQPVDREDLERMLETLAHRGSDGSGTWSEGGIGFGHRQLWTTPESLLERLPLFNPTANLVITADARIDNRNELMQVLELPDRPVDKVTDSEFILAAYEKWGDRCPDYLLGDFAFAIWDKSTQSLFCARDHFGVKPFYYYLTDQQFLFASEIKALFCLPHVPRQLNEARIADFLVMMMEDKAITTYQNILRLPPAHCLSVSASGVRLWSYWSLDPQRELRLNSDAAYADTFRDVFTEAVRCRLRSAFPIGSQLSGGLDSSAVTCVARQLLNQEELPTLHTISNVFDLVRECDERPFINAVLGQGGLIHHEVHPDQLGPLSNLNEIWQYEDEAFIGPNHYLPWELNRTAKEAGIRVVLDGFDGDTTVSHGITRLTELSRKGEWKTFYQEASVLSKHFNCTPRHLLNGYGIAHLKELAKQSRWIAFAKAVQAIHRHFGVSRKRLIVRCGLKPLIAAWVSKVRGDRQSPSQSTLPHLINTDFAEKIGLEARLQQFKHPPDAPLTVREDHYRGLNTGLLVFVLELLDRSAAAFSIETRHPFLDKRLVEFCLSLPSDQKLRRGWSRAIMRHALAHVLPEVVMWRGGKTSMTPNFLHGFLNCDRHLVDELLNESLGPIEAYINPDVLRETYHQMQANQKVKDADIMTTWRAVILALWLKQTQVTP